MVGKMYYICNNMNMRTTISISVSPEEATKTRRIARKRGFPHLSGYVRFLLASDDDVLISEEELVRRSREVTRLHKAGKLVSVASLKDLLA